MFILVIWSIIFFSFALTKLDILDGLDEIKIGTNYMLDGKELTTPPGNTSDLGRVQVSYITLPGWKQNISQCRRFEDLPARAQEYVRLVEQLCEVPGKCCLEIVIVVPQHCAGLAATWFAKLYNTDGYISMWITKALLMYVLFDVVKWIGVGPSRDSIIRVF